MTREEIESGLKKHEIIAPLLSDDICQAQKRLLLNEIVVKLYISDSAHISRVFYLEVIKELSELEKHTFTTHRATAK